MSGPSDADVDRPDVVVPVVVVGRRLVLVDVARLPGERVVDDRELEALAAMDRQHLHRLGVGVEPQRAILVGAVAVGVGDPLPQPGGQRGDPELLLGRGGVQQLARRVRGRSAGARRRHERAPAGGRPRSPRSSRAAPPRRGCGAAPAQRCSFACSSSQAALVGRGHLLRGPAEEGGERGRARRAWPRPAARAPRAAAATLPPPGSRRRCRRR